MLGTRQHGNCSITVTREESCEKNKKGSDLITFYWDVPVDGFQWIEARKSCPQPIEQSHLAPVERCLALPHNTYRTPHHQAIQHR
jgi:hypothetical protein